MDMMRRLSFRRIVTEEEEVVDEGGDFCYSRMSSLPQQGRRSIQRSSSLASALSYVCSRKRFSYDKLSQVPIQLTVVKLDGSSFEIDVDWMATIADLKLAVERAFSHLPTKGPGKISWRHVWAQFCLSFRGQKLVIDTDFIKDYGIREGDQLRFVRNVSIAYNLIKKRSRKRFDAPKPCTVPEDYEEEIQKVEEAYDNLQNLRYREYKYEVEDISTQNQYLLSQLFRGWFLYSKLSSRDYARSEEGIGPSRLAGGFIGCFRSLFQFCDNRTPSYSRISQVEG